VLAMPGRKHLSSIVWGDYGFMLGMFLLFTLFGTLDFSTLFELVKSKAANGSLLPGDAMITAVCILLFIGATGKSAQVPLYVWLPDAMEGPTPVSALIHAATMVTAGVYMVARCNALFVLAPTAMLLVAIVGALTAIFAASIGLVQNDIKKVLPIPLSASWATCFWAAAWVPLPLAFFI
jgi:NADH-quinone oxidoreductase subunit L